MARFGIGPIYVAIYPVYNQRWANDLCWLSTSHLELLIISIVAIFLQDHFPRWLKLLSNHGAMFLEVSDPVLFVMD